MVTLETENQRCRATNLFLSQSATTVYSYFLYNADFCISGAIETVSMYLTRIVLNMSLGEERPHVIVKDGLGFCAHCTHQVVTQAVGFYFCLYVI